MNWPEVLARVIVGPEPAKLELSRVSIAVLPFEAAMAHGASAILARHRGVLSLGDCTCIATAAAGARQKVAQALLKQDLVIGVDEAVRLAAFLDAWWPPDGAG